MKNDLVIGVLGGMGTYATINLFKQYADIFPAEKEWDRPRIIIDNRCTMPSRVRAYLYHENVDELVCEMTESMQKLLNAGCNRIILACNTSHLFLPAIYQKVPKLDKNVVNIIDTCVNRIKADGLKSVFLLASEGTIDSHIYQNSLIRGGNINCLTPRKEEYGILRDCIEAVKQNKYTDDIQRNFLSLINRHESCILGCTELPILYDKYQDGVICQNVYDPLLLALCELKREYDND